MKIEKYSKAGSQPPNYILISQSKIPNAGKGAFSKIKIKSGKTFGEYLGKIYTTKADLEIADGDYLFSVRKKGKEVKIIDGSDPTFSSWVRFINSPLKFEEGNAHFYQYSGRIFIKAMRDILPGEEILAYYGDQYVNDRLK